MVHAEYMHTMLAFKTMGINFTVQTIGNESLITRARNTLISNFWSMEDFTHLLFLDADVFLDVNGLKNMLFYDKDVIGAPVALKGKRDSGETIWNTDADPSLDVKLQSVNWIGTAAFMLSRKAVSALVEDAVSQDRAFIPSQHKGVTKQDDVTHYDIFQVGLIKGQYLSEDFWVCHKLRQLGFEIFVDTSIMTRHSGIVAFD